MTDHTKAAEVISDINWKPDKNGAPVCGGRSDCLFYTTTGATSQCPANEYGIMCYAQLIKVMAVLDGISKLPVGGNKDDFDYDRLRLSEAVSCAKEVLTP